LEDGVKVLFIGGTGLISSACVELAVARGIDVVLLNRGNATRPPRPEHRRGTLGAAGASADG